MDDLPIELIAAGSVALVVAIAAWFGDRRRMRRSNPDAVGFMPWRDVFFWAFLAAVVLFGLAVKDWLVG